MRVTTPSRVFGLALVGLLSATSAMAQSSEIRTHMGHVADALYGTPSGMGLLPTAVAEAEIAALHAGLAAEDPTNLVGIQRHVGHVLHAIDPTLAAGGPGLGYGLRQAAEGVALHIGLAAESEGASDNVTTHTRHIGAAAANLVERAEAIVALAQRIQAATSTAETAAPLAELAALSDALVFGIDLDGDGRVGWRDGEGGVRQATQHMTLMKRGEARQPMNMDSIRSLTVLALCTSAASCSAGSSAIAYTGATVWDGTGAPSVADATIVVDGGRIVAIGPDVPVPAGATTVSLAGRYVIPGLVETHAHVSGSWAPEGISDELERVRGDLLLYARYGVTTVNSLGDGEAVIAVRDAASPTDGRARLLAAGEVVAANDPAGARAAAIANADAGVDWLKLRVDDNLGASEKMPWEAVAAVMEVGEERGIPVATHLFYLEDAKKLLELGSGLIAHSVRDTDVDDEFVSTMRTSGVCYVPTLVREVSTFVYADRPDFFDDPFFLAHASRAEMERASEPEFMTRMRESPSAAGYRVALGQAQRNLKVLSDAGIRIAMGTDAGPAARFPGYFEHMELQLMVDAGLTPEQVLRSATSVAADCLGLDDVGTLEPGNWADFLVLGEDPLRSVQATRTLERVYIAGGAVQ